MAAYDGFQTVWCNGMRYLIVAGVGEIMMFVGKIMIAAGTTALFYVLITFIPTIKSSIIEPVYALVVCYMFIRSLYSLFHISLLCCLWEYIQLQWIQYWHASLLMNQIMERPFMLLKSYMNLCQMMIEIDKIFMN